MTLNREALGRILPVLICLLVVVVWLPAFGVLSFALRTFSPASERSLIA